MEKDARIESWGFKKWSDVNILGPTLFFIVGIGLQLLYSNIFTTVYLVLITVIWLVVLYFFRDPDREVVKEPGLIMGPCDGTVVGITTMQEDRYLKAETVRISIFLSLISVHVQRIPLAGKISLVDHQPGGFVQAYKPQASQTNDYIAMVVDTPYGQILVKQIAGILARRCVNYAKPGHVVETGQRYGLIKFGSRVDIFVPPHAKTLVSEGDKVFGGLTRIAQFSDERINREY